MDYGFVHWNVILLMVKTGDGTIYHVDELCRQRALVPSLARDLDRMLARWGIQRRQVWRFVAGADVFARRGTDGGTVADQWADEGWTLEAANDDRINGAAEYLRWLGDVERRIRPRMFYFRNCARTIETIPQMMHDPHRPEDVLKIDCDEDGEGGDDAYDASRYGLMAVAQTLPELRAGGNPVAGWRG
jgi:hypothetical protein